MYEWLVTPFNLCNEPTNVTRLIKNVLHCFIDLFLKVYLDDILIFSNSSKYNLSLLMQVLIETLKHDQSIPTSITESLEKDH